VERSGFKTHRSGKGRQILVQRFQCRTCGRTFLQTPKYDEDLKVRAINAYFDVEGSYRAVARELGVKADTVWGWVQELGTQCRGFPEVAATLHPCWDGFLLADGRAVGIGGVKHSLCLTADATTQDIPTAHLAPGEDAASWRHTLESLQAVGYTPKALIVDDSTSLWAALDYVYPLVPRQLCVIHVMRDLHNWLRYKAHVPLIVATPFIDLCHRLCYAVNASHAATLRMKWDAERPRFIGEGLGEAVAIFEGKFGFLWTHFADPRMPRDTNVIEGIIHQLGRKLDDTDGFQTVGTAWATIQLLIMRYRFHAFSCSRYRGHNGKSPLNLAGVNTDGLNWIRFARRKAALS
jgi:hypothetical protein